VEIQLVIYCCTVHCMEIQLVLYCCTYSALCGNTTGDILLYSALCGDTADDILLYSALCGDTAGDVLLTICYSGDRMKWEEMGEPVIFVVERRSAYWVLRGGSVNKGDHLEGWQGIEWINLARWGYMADL